MRFILCATFGWALVGAAPLYAQSPDDAERAPDDDTIVEASDGWIDHLHDGLYSLVWRSAMRVDQMFGPRAEDWVYQDHVRGSITPALFWDEHNGFDQKFRFGVKLPLPHLDERFDAFVGTFNRDEYVTEREQQSGAIAHQHVGGSIEDDETLFGIRYRPQQGGRFEADAGLRLNSPIDPFVKGGYRYSRGTPERLLLSLRETIFWQHSEGFGITSRIDLEHIVDDAWLVRWTGSVTLSEETQGVHGYTALTAYRALGKSRAIGVQVFTDGEFDAAVPLGEYGIRVAYRQRIFRDWLVLEIRPSVTWPKELPEESRRASWGLGIGVEMFFGDEGFQARPATF
jgi:hypothetical protein